MNLVKYEIFVKTVECGSLSKAAKILGYTQSNVSHVIQSLENQMGLTLMHRSKSGIILTEQGEQLLPMMRKVLEDNYQMEHKVEEIKGKEKRELRIGTLQGMTCVGLPECLKWFRRDFPELQIELVNMTYENILDALEKRTLDVGLFTDRDSLKVDFEPLYSEELLAVLPDIRSLAKLASYPVKRFGEDPFIYPTHSLRYDVDKLLDTEHVSPYKAFQVYGDEAVTSMVENELGVSILPEFSLANRRMKLLTRPLVPRHYRTVGLGYIANGTNAEIVGSFRKYLREAFQKLEENMPAG